MVALRAQRPTGRWYWIRRATVIKPRASVFQVSVNKRHQGSLLPLWSVRAGQGWPAKVQASTAPAGAGALCTGPSGSPRDRASPPPAGATTPGEQAAPGATAAAPAPPSQAALPGLPPLCPHAPTTPAPRPAPATAVRPGPPPSCASSATADRRP